MTVALDLKRRHEQIVGVARMQMKLGLRALKKHEAAILHIVHPGKEVLICSVDKVFEVGPLPHGLTAAQLAALLKAWAWTAKPLKPTRALDAGRYWEVGTPVDPPATILHTDRGSVTVTCMKSRATRSADVPLIHASARTKKHMLTQPGSCRKIDSSDPWLASDPWKSWTPTVPADPADDGQEVLFTDGSLGHGGAHAARSKIDALALEKRLFEHVDNQLAAAVRSPPGLPSMDTDEPDKHAVEIQELREENRKVESWFNDVGTRFCGLDSKFAAQQSQLECLQASLQRSVAGLNSSCRAELQASMDSQMSRFEALLEKRA